MSNHWTMNFNGTKGRVAELVSAEKAPDGEAVSFEAARAEILARLAALPGPNAHVDAHGAGPHSPVIFVGEGDPHKVYPDRARAAAPTEEVPAEQDLEDPALVESMKASDEAASEPRVA